MKKIRSWEELSKVPANDNFKIIINSDLCSGWIAPVYDEIDMENNLICNCSNLEKMNTEEFYRNHIYLSTHSFYQSHCKKSTEILQKCGFDVELE